MMGRIGTLLFLFAILPTLLFAQPSKPPIALKVGDQVRVAVIGFEEFSGSYFVLSDGSMSGVGFGRIQAEKKTLAEVAVTITARLKRFVNDPQVQVFLVEEQPRSVFVVRLDPIGLAGVQPSRANLIAFRPELDLRQVIAISGPPQRPEFYETAIFRDGKLYKSVNLQKLLAGDPKEWNGPMEPNDMVTLSPIQSITVYVLGIVVRPGEYSVREGASLADALAAALGVPEIENGTQDRREVVLRRGPSETTFPLTSIGSAQAMLQAGDTIEVRKRAMLRISVVGEVKEPGEFELEPGTTVGQAVGATAGGPTREASLKRVLVQRKDQVLVVDATPANASKAPVGLESGDIIYVLKNEEKIFVLGTVRNPGAQLIPDDRELRLVDALAGAGGLNDRGSLRRIYILTAENGRLITKQYNLDEFMKDGNLSANPKLKPGDVILFGQPKGVTITTLTQVLTNLVLLDNLSKR